MLRSLLICGLLAGLLAGIASFGTASLIGEPALADAIAYEEASAAPEPAVAADGHSHSHDEGTAVSRSTQSGIGLLTATAVYGLAFGGLFALLFAYLYGRIAQTSPRVTAAWLGALGFFVVFVVPFSKYPATPPAIGDPNTISERTVTYFGMIVISLLAAFIAVRARAWLAKDHADLATTGGIITYLVIVLAAGVFLPSFNEITADFSATLLWEFRKGTFGTQLTMWFVLTAVFAYGAQRVMTRDQRAVSPTPAGGNAAATHAA